MKKLLSLALTLGAAASLISVAIYAANPPTPATPPPVAPKAAEHPGDKLARGGPGMDRGDRGPGARQHRPDPEQMKFMAHRAQQLMQHQRERRAEELGLTADQRAKMRLIAFQHREKQIALQQGMRAEMEAVLTPEQKAKAKELKERQGKMQQGPRGPGHRHHDDDDDDDEEDDDKKGPPPGH